MASDDTAQTTQPVDPSLDVIVPADGPATDDLDPDGHSLLMVELGRTIDADRMLDVQRMNGGQGRAREAHPNRVGGLLKRISGR
jgi:hypothetical protein